MRLLVCGGRNFGNKPSPFPKETYQERYAQFIKERNFIEDEIEMTCGDVKDQLTIISGAAPGVDSVAIQWAIDSMIDLEEYPAEWNKYGKAAGPIRNQQMLDEGKPDKVLAINGGKGTADMVRRAKKAGVPVIEVRYAPD